MPLLIRAATVLDTQSPYHLQTKDLLVDNGMIREVKHRIDHAGAEIFDAEGLYLSPGWFDMMAFFCDPGYEYKEDLSSGLRAAAAGGFTGVAVFPDTRPVADSKSEIEYLLNQSRGNIVDLYPVGAVTKKCEGKELAEIYDMHRSGAVAFSDAPKPIMTAGLMMRGLLYVKKINGVIISLPMDETIAPGGQMNEGASSVFLGMNGIPALAEDIMVVRDIELAEYTGSRVHFSCISTKEAVDRIREAKKKGIPVTAGVNPVHLILDDSTLTDYDSNYKIFPPLRTKEDIEALKTGLTDGTIDVICSAHQPQNDELKTVEFEYAAAGIINLQTCFALANEALGSLLKPEQIVEKISSAPRKILGLPLPAVKENSAANFTIFDLNAGWSLKKESIVSKSVNTPLIGRPLKGKPAAIFNHQQLQKL
jgi:dihydroorotase